MEIAALVLRRTLFLVKMACIGTEQPLEHIIFLYLLLLVDLMRFIIRRQESHTAIVVSKRMGYIGGSCCPLRNQIQIMPLVFGTGAQIMVSRVDGLVDHLSIWMVLDGQLNTQELISHAESIIRQWF